MSSEAQCRFTLNIIKGTLRYRNQNNSFNVDVSLAAGPFVGTLLVPTAGVAVPLTTYLVTPGICVLTNLDPDNYVEYGIRDSNIGYFYYLGELGPGEEWPLKLSRNLLSALTSGTGTSGDIHEFWLKANTAACYVSVAAFEK